MEHYIKIRQSFADAVYSGEKTFEVRKNDRGYQKGDTFFPVGASRKVMSCLA